MSLSNFAKAFVLVLALLAVPGFVLADGERPVAEYKRKPCDYDRNKDEEKSSGDCTGTVPTPEPLTILLFSAGLAGVGFAARKRLRKEV